MDVVGGIDGGLVGTIVCTPQSQCRLPHTLKKELSEEAKLGVRGESSSTNGATRQPANGSMGLYCSQHVISAYLPSTTLHVSRPDLRRISGTEMSVSGWTAGATPPDWNWAEASLPRTDDFAVASAS
jgi:hypothetical protein